MPLWLRQKIQAMPRQTDLKTIPVVALVLENHQGDILIQQRKPGSHLAGLWEFPGGKVEATESLEDALIREIEEELQFTPSDFRHLITLNHQYTDKSIQLVVYHQVANNPQVTGAENQPLKWVSKQQLNTFPMPEADLPIIELLVNTK